MQPPKFHFKACPRCKGDLIEQYGERSCVQCGWLYHGTAIQAELPRFKVNKQDVERRKREAYRLFAQGYGVAQVSEITGAQLRWVERWYARHCERRLARA